MSAAHASAQDAAPQAPTSPDEYAWGERADRAPTEDPVRIMLWLGAGGGFRPLRNLDPPFTQDFGTPAYLDLAGAVFAPGTDIRHGGGVALSTNISSDPSPSPQLLPFQQWAVTPSYHLLVPFYRVAGMADDIVQLQIRVGIPIVFSRALATGVGTETTFGGELGLGFNFKFLAGLGMYLELQGAIYGGTENTVHPVLTADAGFVIDYEVL